MYSAILLAGGKGARMQKSVPKQYLLLAGKPVIIHSLERLDELDEISEIVVVCEQEYTETITQLLTQYNITKEVFFALAGQTRQESVYNGLKKARNEMVIIHEAARPFATINDFKKLIAANSTNALLGYSVPYTIVEGDKKLDRILDRSKLINVQLPQKFSRFELLKAHEKAFREGCQFTEDASLLFYYEKSNIEIIEGSNYNIKLTEALDMLIGEIIYKEYIARRR